MTEALPAAAAVAILGSGTMGRGIARVAAGAGHQVFLIDVSAEALHAAEVEMKRYLDRDVEKGRLEVDTAGAIADRIHYSTDAAASAGAALVIEAIVEDLDAKVGLLRQIEAHVAPTAIIATNTSSLSVTAIASRLDRPDRVAGLHFFNPAPVMPLVEVVAGADSSAAVLDTLALTAQAWGKTPVRAASTPGFIVNRVARPFYGEALRIVEEHLASPAEVDAIVTGAGGFRMGPFALMDLVGLDVNLAVSKSVYEQTSHDPRFAPNQLQQQLVEAGRLGRKTGRGFFNYESPDNGDDTRVVAPEAAIGEIIANDGGGELAPLVARLAAAGVAITEGGGPAGIAVGTTLLWPSDGRPVGTVSAAPDLVRVAVDEAIDWSGASGVAVAGHDDAALGAAAGVLALAGMEARRVDDGPGLVLLRIMSQLASVAADVALKRIATPQDIDTAMRLGTNYPIGPLEWADRAGVARVVAVLDNMADYYGEPRYRPSSHLRRVADSGGKLRGAND